MFKQTLNFNRINVYEADAALETRNNNMISFLVCLTVSHARLVLSIFRYFYSSFYYWMCFERFKVENEKEKKQKKNNSNQPHRPNVYTFILVESQWNYLYVWMNVMKNRSTKVSFIHFRRSRLRGFSCNRMEYLAITKIKWNEITKKETHTIERESFTGPKNIKLCINNLRKKKIYGERESERITKAAQ